MGEEGSQDSLIVSVMTKFAASSSKGRPSEPPTIGRVPHIIRQTNPEAYDPELISIGPYHRGNKRLQSMEKQKWKYLQDFSSRNSVHSLDGILHKVQQLRESALKCYSEDITVGEDEFAEMLAVDACFILELFLKAEEKKEKRMHENDLIFAPSSEWVLKCVARDLLLAENQLPFSLLHQIFDFFAKPITSTSLSDLAMDFFRTPYYSINKMEASVHSRKKSFRLDEASLLHLLHLVHSHFVESSEEVESFDSSRNLLPLFKGKQKQHDDGSTVGSGSESRRRPLQTIPHAKRLQDSGISFKRRIGTNFLGLKFEDGVMEIPHLVIDYYTDTFLRNLIAFEHCNPFHGKHFTFYAAFMEFVVNTAQDVEILHQSGVIDHGLGSDKNIAEMFNRMCRGLVVESDIHDKYHKLTRDILIYYKTPWNMWKAKLNRDYFGSPWAIISLSAGILAICLALTNTVFSIYRYYHPSP